MVILSLFDGMSCGRLALERAGIKVTKYYASEIDVHAIKVSKLNYPDIIHIGDVTKVRYADGTLYTENGNFEVGQIDMLLGGSPCQGFSFAGDQLAFDDPRSKLFFDFVRIKRECSPRWFLLENVQMADEHERIITQYMEINQNTINSELVSAQNRVRLYWTNVNAAPVGFFGDIRCHIPQPKDRGILLEHILQPEEEVDEKYYLSDTALNRISENLSDKLKKGLKQIGVVNNHGHLEQKDQKSQCIDANYWKGMDNHSQRTMVFGLREAGDNPILLVKEATKKGFAEISPGESFDLRHPNSDTRRGRKMNGKCNTLIAQNPSILHFTKNFRIRKFTPVECERLQTVPDNYTASVSDTQRYHMLGNGWTVDVIVYLLSFLPKQN